jgi:L-fuconolactonase
MGMQLFYTAAVRAPFGVQNSGRIEAVSLQPRPGWGQRMEAIVDPELRICDPHHHLLDVYGFNYLAPALVADVQAGHNVTSTVYIECTMRYRTDGPEHLRPAGELEFVVAQDAPGDVMAAIVGFADLRLGDRVDEILDAHEAAGQGRFRGIRFMTPWDPDPALRIAPAKPGPRWLQEPEIQRGAAAVGRRGLALDCFLYSHQLDDVVAIAQALPDQTFVLDHLGTPVVTGAYAHRVDEVRADWRAALARVAACSNVVLKIGGLNMHTIGAPWVEGDTQVTSPEVAAFWGADVRRCIDLFGPARCMFESNFPVDRVNIDYVTLWNAFKLMTSDYSATERAALFHDTAVSTYQIGG